jgi:hypothetical protein
LCLRTRVIRELWCCDLLRVLGEGTGQAGACDCGKRSDRRVRSVPVAAVAIQRRTAA